MKNTLVAIQKELARLLSTITLRSGQIDTIAFTYNFEKFSHLVIQSYGEWLSKFDIANIVFREIQGLLPDNIKNEQTTSSLNHVLGVQKLIEIQQNFIKTLEEIPKTYYFYIPVPEIEFLGNYFEFNHLTHYEKMEPEKLQEIFEIIITARNIQGSSTEESINKIAKSHCFICTPGTGYIDTQNKGTALENALSTTKHILVSGMSSNLLINNPFQRKPVNHYDGIYLTSNTRSINKTSSFDILPYNITRAIFGYQQNDNHILSPSFNKEETINQIHKYGKLLTKENNDENMQPISTSIEWSFQAFDNENLTFRYVQTCIALEAILGDSHTEKNKGSTGPKEPPTPNTKLLADRLAYLIGGKKSDRQTIKSTFYNIYQLRSDLVHGRSKVFSPNSIDLLEHAQKYLLMAIDRELYFNIKD